MSPSFIAVDFETANRTGGISACQVALVRVVDGQVVDRLATYLRPPAGFDHFDFTYLHGISASDVESAPSWDQASEQVVRFVDGDPVYAHNAAFDARVWQDLDSFFHQRTRPARFYCSYRLAQATITGLVNYKLPTVTEHCVPGFRLDHHQADSDAEACGLIVASIQAMSDVANILG